MAPHPILLPCALAFPPPSHRDATTPSPCWAPHFMTQERIMFSNPRYSPDDPYYRLGPVHTCLYVRVRETGDWDLFLGPLEWTRAETGGAD